MSHTAESLKNGASGEAVSSPGLTTTKAPFIEQARAAGETFIRQPYELYTEENHATWRRLYAGIREKWTRYAHPRFLQGVESLLLSGDAIPRLDDVNAKLAPLSGFKARAVSGYVPAYVFFDNLRTRNFPTTITIRDGSTLIQAHGRIAAPSHHGAQPTCLQRGLQSLRHIQAQGFLAQSIPCAARVATTVASIDHDRGERVRACCEAKPQGETHELPHGIGRLGNDQTATIAQHIAG